MNDVNIKGINKVRLAVIPARGGSKRIPRKNIKMFAGKPIIALSIEAARKSGCFDLIIVSTDDDEIADVAIKYGAMVPFKRPPLLADDYTGITPVIKHAVEWYNKNSKIPSQICCIYATAPLLNFNDIISGHETLIKTESFYTLSVANFSAPIQRAFRITDQKRIEMFNPSMFNVRSQDLEIGYHDAAQFCWGRAEAWINELPIFDCNTTVVTIPRIRVQDIDTQEDWEIAETLYNLINKSNVRNDEVYL